jgi:hypothetical protein
MDDMLVGRSLPCLAASLLLVLAACNENQDGPRPREVVPPSAESHQDTPIRILGEGFRVLVHASYDDPDRSLVDNRFTARLGAVELTGVTYVGPTTLEATVQAGLPTGLHDLEVVDPRGRRGALSGAFEILGDLDAAPGDAAPGDAAPGDAALVDASDLDVGVDVPLADVHPTDAPVTDVSGGGLVQHLLTDPFGDATAFSFVFKYGDKIYLGPNKDGTGAVRVNADGTGTTKISFSFAADTSGGNVSQNTAAAPYTGIGFSGCSVNTPQCGPDNEDGRGIFAAGSINGTEWLVMAGARTAGDLDYVYMTADTDAKLDMRYVDLATEMGPQTRGTSTMHVLGNRVYLGFPDTGGKRPYLVVLKVTPGAPGLDVSTTAEAENLGAHKMPGIGCSAAMSIIDSMADLNNRVYVFNNGGCMRATVAQPTSYEIKPSDWADCTPSNPEYSARTAITTSKVQGIEPADKAFSQVAVYNGRLYAGRNTTAGPQLWACDPTISGDNGQCEPGDWKLVAANTTGDAALTQLNNASNTRITLVASTPTHLYLGFDNAQGVVLFRSAAAAPATAADFTGESGCSATAHPAGCTGIGGNGLGSASNTRLFDAVGASFTGASYLYLTAGSGSGPVRVYRVPD